jgi:SAM-dependent methyltransferase
MSEINLLKNYPSSSRNIKSRVINKDFNREVALKFGQEYFDGSREQGYGGYHYDGRWIPVAHDIVNYFKLSSGMKLLDVGCAKGYLCKDLVAVCPGLEVYGIDISEYAISMAHPEVKDYMQVADARSIPYPDNFFDAVISINTIHNLNRPDCILALKEIQRLSRGKSYIQVDAYRNDVDRKLFEDWMLTAKTYDTPSGWVKIFEEAGYSGDYFWTIMEV